MKMVQQYQSKYTRESLTRSGQGGHIADLEKKVLGHESVETQTKKVEESLKQYEKEVEGAVLGQYEGATHAVLQLGQALGLPVAQWAQNRQLHQAQHDVAGLEHAVSQYQKRLTTAQKTVQEYRDLRTKAEMLMERYDAALIDMDVRFG